MVTMRTPASATRLYSFLCLAVAMITATSAACFAGVHPGEAIFREKCADCHGADGQGDPIGYDAPLAGELSIAELASRIEETMPEGEPDACVGAQARDVAEYIHRAFYSYEARLRNGLVEPPRVELVRLTAPQYRKVVAELINQTTPRDEPRRRRRRRRRGRANRADASSEPQPGLRGQYFQSDGMSKANELVVDRVDASVVFDFQDGSPVEGITADQFAIIWQGSLHANDTGFYEFRVRTQNGARLYVNQADTDGRPRLRDDSGRDGQSAFIDAWVGSGELREREGRIFLTGGRSYPLRLEFFKYLEDSASIALEWKPPHGVWSPLDARHVSTGGSRQSYVVDTPFPADDRSLGYERGSGVSREWHEATTNASIAAAEEVVRRMGRIADLGAEDGGEAEFKNFLANFASTAFRRPLSDAEAEFFRTAPFQDAPDLETAVRRGVLMVLQSPYLLYVDVMPNDEVDSQHAVAARLALTLWDSIPDEPLREAANAGELATAEQIEAQARRMLDDPRTRYKMRGFFRHWLELEERDLSKDMAMFPEFDEAVIADLRYSLEQFIEGVLWSEKSDYRELLLADYLVLNDRLRQLYQPESADAAGDKTAEAQRSEPKALASGAHHLTSILQRHSPTTAARLISTGPDDNETSKTSDQIPTESDQVGYQNEAANVQAEDDADAKNKSKGDDQADDNSAAANDADDADDQADEKEGDETSESKPTYKVVAQPPPFDEFAVVEFPPERRTGVLTHPYLLSAFAYHNNTSPIHRGVFLTRNIVGRGLKPPPIAVEFENDEFPAELTMREKITQLTRDAACMSCHSVINPLGFALENFDPVGRWRTSENDKPLDTRSQYTTDDGQTIELTGARDIAEFAAGSEPAHRAFVTQMFLHLVKQPPRAYGPDVIDRLREQFVDDQFNMQNLMVRVAVLSASRGLAHDAPPQ